ncbi:MAG: ABC transporter permease [Vicinamibacterales bacterium]
MDFRLAWRSLAGTPAFTLATVLTLTLGIGVNTALLSIVDPLLLRPLPYANPETLVALRSTNPAAGFPDHRTSHPDVLDWQARTRLFEAITGYRWRTVDLVGGGTSERLSGLFVTPGFFDVFGIAGVVGRSFDPGDHVQGAQPTIILGSQLWRRRFAADAGIVGELIDVNSLNLSRVGSTPRRVIGVTTRDVQFPPFSADFQLGVASIDNHVEFWTPEPITAIPYREARELEVVGRLRAGVTIAQAQAEMDRIAEQLATEHRENVGWGVRVVPLRHQILGGTRRAAQLLWLCGAVVLVVAWLNVVAVQVARAMLRRGDTALQRALGASSSRIIRQTFVESFILTGAAATISTVVVAWSAPLLRFVIPSRIPLVSGAGVNLRVLWLTAGVALMTAACVAVVPALQGIREVPGALGSFGRGLAPDRRSRHALGGLVAIEVALTLMLLIGVGLMARSAVNLSRVDPGFSASTLLTMTISLPSNKFEWAHNVVFSRDVIAAVEGLGMVESAAVVQGLPMRPGSFFGFFAPEGAIVDPARQPVARLRVVSPGYFHVMQIPLISGRDFDERDETGEIGFAPNVIVSQALAKRHWPGEDAVGKRMQTGSERWSTIIGVAGDVRYAGMDTEPDLEIYLPEGLFPQAAITLLARTRTDPPSVIDTIRTAITRVDRDAFVTDIRPMSDLIAASLAPRRLSALVITLFACIALSLAVAGIYGVIGQSIAQRRLEIAIRMALGAGPGSVSRLILQSGFRPALAGVSAGAIASLLLVRLLGPALFGVGPYDLLTWGTAITVVIAAGWLAGYIPSRRAARIAPADLLRA